MGHGIALMDQDPHEVYREAPELLLWQVPEAVILAQKSGGISNAVYVITWGKSPVPAKNTWDRRKKEACET